MSSSGSVISRVRMLEKRAANSEALNLSSTPRSAVTKNGTVAKSPSIRENAVESRPSKVLPTNRWKASSVDALGNTSNARPELVGWPSSDDDDRIPPPTFAVRTGTVGSSESGRRRQPLVTSRYQQAILTDGDKLPLRDSKSSHTRTPVEDSLPSPKPTLQVRNSRIIRFNKALSNDSVKSPVALNPMSSSTGIDMVGWPLGKTSGLTDSSTKHSSQQQSASLAGLHNPVRATRFETPKEVGINNMSLTTSQRGIEPSPQSVRIHVSSESTNSSHDENKPPDATSPVSTAWPSPDTVSNSFSSSPKSTSQRTTDASGTAECRESRIGMRQARLGHSRESQSSSSDSLKQSLGDAVVVLNEERLSSLGSVSSSQRSSLSASELGSIARRAMDSSVASDELSNTRPPLTIRTDSGKRQKFRSSASRVKGKAHLSLAVSADDSVTAWSSKTADSRLRSTANTSSDEYFSTAPERRSSLPSKRLASVKKRNQLPALTQSNSSGAFPCVSRDMGKTQAPSMLPMGQSRSQYESRASDNGSVGSTLSSSNSLSSRRMSLLSGQRRLVHSEPHAGETRPPSGSAETDPVAHRARTAPPSTDTAAMGLNRHGIKAQNSGEPQSVVRSDAPPDPSVPSKVLSKAFGNSTMLKYSTAAKLSANSRPTAIKSEEHGLCDKMTEFTCNEAPSHDKSKVTEAIDTTAICMAPPGRVSDHPAYRARPRSKPSTPYRMDSSAKTVSPSSTPAFSAPHNGIDQSSPAQLGRSNRLDSENEPPSATSPNGMMSLDSAFVLPTLSSSTIASGTGAAFASRRHSPTEGGGETVVFADFLNENPFRESDLIYSTEDDEYVESSFAAESSTLIGQFHVKSFLEQDDQIALTSVLASPQASNPSKEDMEGIVSDHGSNIAPEKEASEAQGERLVIDKKEAVRWWQRNNKLSTDEVDVSVCASNPSSAFLTNVPREDLFAGLHEETHGAAEVYTHSSDESSDGTESAPGQRNAVAPHQISGADTDGGFGAMLDGAELQPVHSDITSSVLAGKATTELKTYRRQGKGSVLGNDADDRPQSGPVKDTISTGNETLNALSNEETKSATHHSDAYSESALSGHYISPRGPESLHNNEEVDNQHRSIFMRFGLDFLDSFAAGICRPPGATADDLILSPVSTHDQPDSDRVEYECKSSPDNGSGHTLGQEEPNAAVIAPTQSEEEPASVTQATMNDKEKKLWNEWDQRDFKERQPTSRVTRPLSGSPLVAELTSDLSSSSEKHSRELRTEAPHKVLVHGNFRSKSTKGSPSTPLRHDQHRILEKFSSTLKNHSLEVLKLNRDNKWQVRYLTVSKEVFWLNAGVSSRRSGNKGQIPLGILWPKRFSGGRSYTVESIRNAQGGLLLSHLMKVSASRRADAKYPIDKKHQKKFANSVTVNIKCGGRVVRFRCKTTAEAHFLCTGLRVVVDVLMRESKIISNKE